MKKLYATAALALAAFSSGCGRVQGPMPVRIVDPVVIDVKKSADHATSGLTVYDAPKPNPKFLDSEGNFRWYIKDSEFKDKAEMNAYHAERDRRDVNQIGPARKAKKTKTLDEMAREKGW